MKSFRAKDEVGMVRMRERLHTARLGLRLPVASDAEDLHAIFSDPQTNTIGDGPFESQDQTDRWIANRQALYAQHGLAWYLVRLLDGDVLLGNCGMLITRGTVSEPEIGYMIRASHQGFGYATEAAQSVLAEASGAGIRTVWSTIRPSNGASCRVIERVGFRVQRTENDDKGALRYYTRALGGLSS